MLIDLISFAISFVIISEFGEVVWQKTLGAKPPKRIYKD